MQHLISRWVRRYQRSLSNESDRVDPANLYLTLHNLPHSLSLSRYDLVKTVRMRSRRGNERSSLALVPAALLPINIILVAVEPCAPPILDFPCFVCNNFDITLCCVALVVNADLSFDFRGFDCSFQALHAKKLVLRDCAFGARKGSVTAQMKRVLKYLERGFSW